MSPDLQIPGESEAMAIDMQEQNMSQLAQVGIIAQQNFVTISKATDYDYLQGKALVSLSEAVGVREVASKTNPAGPDSSVTGNK